jgi:hypothetical protein
LLAIALPGMHVALVVFSAVLIAWSVVRLLMDGGPGT